MFFQWAQEYWSQVPSTTNHQTLKKTPVCPSKNTFDKEKKKKKTIGKLFSLRANAEKETQLQRVFALYANAKIY